MKFLEFHTPTFKPGVVVELERVQARARRPGPGVKPEVKPEVNKVTTTRQSPGLKAQKARGLMKRTHEESR